MFSKAVLVNKVWLTFGIVNVLANQRLTRVQEKSVLKRERERESRKRAHRKHAI